MVDEPSDIHRGVTGAQPRTDRDRILAVGWTAHLGGIDELDCTIEIPAEDSGPSLTIPEPKVITVALSAVIGPIVPLFEVVPAMVT